MCLESWGLNFFMARFLGMGAPKACPLRASVLLPAGAVKKTECSLDLS
jgi:hypothetical protein